MEIGTTLAAARTAAGYTQKQAAAVLGLGSGSTLSAYERGQNTPGADTLAAMAELYGCSADYLLGRADRLRPDFRGLSREHTDAAHALARLPQAIQAHLVGLIREIGAQQA